VDAALLNPAGDRLGDGVPGWRASGEELHAAWIRPTSCQVIVAWSGGRGWDAQWALDAPGALGTPRVAQWSPQHVVLVWQAHVEDGTTTELAFLQHQGGRLRGAQRVSLAATLLDVAQGDDALHVVALEGGLATDFIFYVPIPPINPIDWTVVRLDPALDVPLDTLPGIAAHVAGMDLRVSELRGASGKQVVLTWWSGPRELSFVELADDGPVLPVETLSSDHGPVRPQRLVQEAIRLVSERD
jgi:hypothetical protein